MKLRKAKQAWAVARQLSQCRISTRTANKRYAVAERVYCQTIQPNPVQPSPTQSSPVQPRAKQTQRIRLRRNGEMGTAALRRPDRRLSGAGAGGGSRASSRSARGHDGDRRGLSAAGRSESAQRRHRWAEYGPGVAFEPRVLVPEPAAALCSGTARGEHSTGCT